MSGIRAPVSNEDLGSQKGSVLDTDIPSLRSGRHVLASHCFKFLDMGFLRYAQEDTHGSLRKTRVSWIWTFLRCAQEDTCGSLRKTPINERHPRPRVALSEAKGSPNPS